MKVALVHDWLTGMRGGERVLERLCAMFPDAPITTLVWKRGAVSPTIESHPIRTSFLQGLPDATTRYRWFLPLFPAAIESFRFEGFDAVISVSHAVARAAITPPGTFHLSYINTPMRYIWELEPQYFPPGRFPGPVQWTVRQICAQLRKWDVATSGRPTAMIGNSSHVADRIRRCYGREAEVITPPVALSRFRPARGAREYYLLAGAMAPYKRGDLAIAACARLKRRLVVAGTGQEQTALAKLAGPDVEFIGGWISDERMAQLYAGATALLFPGEEDFGIMPVEAMASGCPVIAYGVGGALETVGRGASPEARAALARGEAAQVPGGVLFAGQTVESMVDAIERFERIAFDPEAVAARAAPFSEPEFDRRFLETFERGFHAFRAGRGI